MPQEFKTVLIIEDDHDVRVTLRQVYESAGYYVFTVTNGHSALELLKLIPVPKLVVCDIRMPIMDGGAFVAHKSQDSVLKDVPLIIMSAYQDHFEKFPDVVCMPKPLDMKQLIMKSEEYIGDVKLISKRPAKT